MKLPHQLKPLCLPVYGSRLTAHTEKHTACLLLPSQRQLFILFYGWFLSLKPHTRMTEVIVSFSSCLFKLLRHTKSILYICRPMEESVERFLWFYQLEHQRKICLAISHKRPQVSPGSSPGPAHIYGMFLTGRNSPFDVTQKIWPI